MRLAAWLVLFLLLSGASASCKRRGSESVPQSSECPQFANGCPVRAAELTQEKGLFAQLSTLYAHTDDELKEYFEHICKVHNTQAKTSTNFIHNIVLQDVADEEGRMYMAYREGLPGTAAEYHPTNHKLDVVMPYLKCFDKVFFGTVDPVWKGSGSLYVEGISSDKFRWDYINKSTTVMDKLKAIFPDLAFNWYLTFEANGNYLNIPSVKEGYKALFRELTLRMAERRQASTLWSPSFWNRFHTLSAAEKTKLGNNLMDLFKTVPHIYMMHFQDFLGASSANPQKDRFTVSDAVGYYRFIAGLGVRPAHVGVNIEHYVVKCPSCAPEAPDAATMVNREEEYLRSEVPIGVSWEIRFWRKAHKD